MTSRRTLERWIARRIHDLDFDDVEDVVDQLLREHKRPTAALRAALGRPEPQLVAVAGMALVRAGERDPLIIGRLLAVAEKHDRLEELASALESVSGNAGGILARTAREHADPEVRRFAVWRLQRLAYEGLLTSRQESALVACLADADVSVRATAAAALGDVSEDLAWRALTRLRRLLRADSAKVQRAVVDVLGTMLSNRLYLEIRSGARDPKEGAEIGAAVEALLDALVAHPGAVSLALRDIPLTAAETERATDRVIAALHAGKGTRWLAQLAARRRLAGAQQALLAASARRGVDKDTQDAIANALQALGYHAPGDLATLIRKLGSRETVKRRTAEDALVKCGAGAVAPLLAALDRPQARVRAGALLVLVRLADLIEGAALPRTIRALGRCLDDEDEQVRHAAVKVVYAVAKQHHPLFPRTTILRLRRALSAHNVYLRGHAALTLGQFGARSAPAVAALVKRLADPDEWVRRCAAQALGEAGAAGMKAVPALRRIVESERTFVGVLNSQTDYFQAAREALERLDRIV